MNQQKNHNTNKPSSDDTTSNSYKRLRKSVRLGCEYVAGSEVLLEGIPSIEVYKKLLKTGLFTEMEAFSNAFVTKYAKAMKGYSNRWTADSFHLWSREWEYPFVFSYIQKFVSEYSGRLKVLDAGSGCTFFPYYITHVFPNCQIYCIDNDMSLFSNFKKINKTQERVEFSLNDLSLLKYENDSFDILYCISVLEHTENPRKIIGEFNRVLRKDGLLILTFDISLDNRSQITIEKASKLLELIDKQFQSATASTSEELLRDVNSKNILTTTYTRDFGDKKLLPWRLTWGSMCSKLVNLQIPQTPFFDLTVLCNAWQNSRKITNSLAHI